LRGIDTSSSPTNGSGYSTMALRRSHLRVGASRTFAMAEMGSLINDRGLPADIFA
jgi:hypothetical protein